MLKHLKSHVQKCRENTAFFNVKIFNFNKSAFKWINNFADN